MSNEINRYFDEVYSITSGSYLKSKKPIYGYEIHHEFKIIDGKPEDCYTVYYAEEVLKTEKSLKDAMLTIKNDAESKYKYY